jgi:tRNA threonylcarbamoyladenosine dehydratase
MRFSRTQLLVGDDGLARLKGARVAIFGIGGVGSFAVEAIARAGVGRILLVDFECVDVTNINRQLIALVSTVGRPKVEVARDRIRDINPDAEVETRREYVTPDNVEALLQNDIGYAIDAIDAVESKVHLLMTLCRRNTRFVSCMGAGSRVTPTGIKVADISRTSHCPLARAVRLGLRRLGVTSGIRCVYSEENLRKMDLESYTLPGPDPEERLSGGIQRVQGTISYMPGLIGLTAAGLIINDILREDIQQLPQP